MTRNVVVVYFVLLLTIPICQPRPVHQVETCGSRKIAVLDLAGESSRMDVTPCHIEQGLHVSAYFSSLAIDALARLSVCNLRLQVRESNGIIYRGTHPDNVPNSHLSGTHAAPWYLAKAIKSSVHYTVDLDSADLVYVDDYCLNMRWLAQVHSFNHEETVSAYALNMAYDLMLRSPRWQRNSGSDYIFYDSHPGFRWGWPGERVREKLCLSFVNSTMLVVDKPMRTICSTFSEMPRVLVTPYNPNSIGKLHSAHVLLPDIKLLEERRTLLSFNAMCHLGKTTNPGKSFRWWLSEHVFANSTNEVKVKCTNGELGGKHQEFNEMFQALSDSRFCLALPGDSASTRRLSEIMLADCIPVFAGPPYHSMPFHHSIDWSVAGVFFNISDFSPWMDGPFHWDMSVGRPGSPNDGRYWHPDVDSSQLNFISINNAAEVSNVGL